MSANRNYRLLWNARIWIVAVALLAAGATYVLRDGAERTYTATATLQVLPGNGSSQQVLTPDQLQSITNVYQRLASTETVRKRAAKALGAPVSQIESGVELTTSGDASIIEVEATNSSADQAARMANAYGASASGYAAELDRGQRNGQLVGIRSQIRDIERQLRESGSRGDSTARDSLSASLLALRSQAIEVATSSSGSLRVVDTAEAPRDPSSPRPKRDAALGLLLGALLAIAGVLVLGRLRDRFDASGEVSAHLGPPVLASLPVLNPGDPAHLETFRTLRVQLQAAAANGAEGGLVVLVTGAEPGVGKSFVSAGLARAFAASNAATVLVDSDMRRPSVHRRFGTALSPGLRDALEDQDVDARKLTQRVAIDDLSAGEEGGELSILGSGVPTDHSTELIGLSRMGQIVAGLRESYDVVLIDSPPVLAVADALILGQLATSTVFVVDAQKSRVAALETALGRLDGVHVEVTGLVVNRQRRERGLFGYQYRYQYSYSAGSAAEREA